MSYLLRHHIKLRGGLLATLLNDLLQLLRGLTCNELDVLVDRKESVSTEFYRQMKYKDQNDHPGKFNNPIDLINKDLPTKTLPANYFYHHRIK